MQFTVQMVKSAAKSACNIISVEYGLLVIRLLAKNISKKKEIPPNIVCKGVSSVILNEQAQQPIV